MPSVANAAFILAGGLGERLRPLTDVMPKPLLEVRHKPILQYNIELAGKFGARKVVLGVGYKAGMIRDFFGDGSKWGIEIAYSEESKPLGTGGALRKAAGFFRGEERFIMMNGDELKQVDYTKLAAVHGRNNAVGTIALTEIEDPSLWGVVKTEGNQVSEFVEKPRKEEAPSNMINAGAYLLSHRIVDILPEGNFSMEREIFPHLATEGKLFATPAVSQWFPADTKEQLEVARREWKPDG